MGKAAKKKQSAIRRAAKKAHKLLNEYKEKVKGDAGQGQSRQDAFRHSPIGTTKGSSPKPSGKKSKRRHAGLSIPTKKGPSGQVSKQRNDGRRKRPNYPLRPKRSR